MIDAGQLYVAAVTALLLAGLGVGVTVLRDVFYEGLDRHRKWRTGELERYTEDTEYGASPPATPDADGENGVPSARDCPHCGTTNDPGFRYCSNCAGPLPDSRR